MAYVKLHKPLRKLRPNLLQIKEQTSFKQTYLAIKSDKQIDIIWIKKPRALQMSAVLVQKLLGRKFFWVQGFENPPVPTLWAKLLIAQADRIVVTSRRDFNKLKRFGVKINKIRIEKT